MNDDVKSTEQAVEEIVESEVQPNVAVVPKVIASVESQVEKKHSKKKILAIIAVVIIFVGSVAGAYFWRDKLATDEINQKNASISSLEDENVALIKDVEQKDANIASLKITNSTLSEQQKKKDEYIALLEDENTSMAEKSAAATANDNTWRDFTSTKYGFSNQFPGIPYQYDFDFYMDGEYSPATAFGRTNTDEGYSYYEVMAVDFSDAFMNSLSDGDNKLYLAMNTAVGYDDGIKIESTELIDFNGQRALKEKFSTEYDGVKYYKYGLVFFKGNRMYVIDSSDTSDADFATFYQSFKLN